MVFKNICMIIIGLGSGAVISGGVFAFITIIGIVPRFAQKTKTQNYMKVYETAITLGGIIGASAMFINYQIPIGKVLAAIYSLCIGIFIGCLAVSLAETLNVIPILTRRAKVQKGLSIFIITLALGKMVGSILYFVVPGFYNP